jgi:hypothetical protein
MKWPKIQKVERYGRIDVFFVQILSKHWLRKTDARTVVLEEGGWMNGWIGIEGEKWMEAGKLVFFLNSIMT